MFAPPRCCWKGLLPTFSHTSPSLLPPLPLPQVVAASQRRRLLLLTFFLPNPPPPSVVAASQRQGLLLTWTPDSVHFLQLAYETFNDLLLNILCPLRQPAHH